MPSSIDVFTGVVKRLHERKKYCYIECPRISEVFGRDAYAKGDLWELENNMKVEFCVDTSADIPMAKEIEIVFAGGEEHVGKVKSMHPTHAHVCCPEVSKHFNGIDIFIGQRHMPSALFEGAVVQFTACISFQGYPQAHNVQIRGLDIPFSMMVTRVQPSWERAVSSCELVVVRNLWPEGDTYERLAREVEFLPRLRGTHFEGVRSRDVGLFNEVVDKACRVFRLRLATAKIFLYPNGQSWRPLHQDAHLFSPALQRTQDTSIVISFGATRSLIFEHTRTQEAQEFPMSNGTAVAFGSSVNRHYRHGISSLPLPDACGPRISIALWGTSER